MAKAPVSRETAIEVTTLQQHQATFWLLGSTPFYCNRVAAKAQRELLMPRGRLTTAQKATNMKHNPPAEFRESPYLDISGRSPTAIQMKATAFKGAIAQAAIDMPTSVAKAQINRLAYVVDEYVPIWGIPLMNMDIVRSADQARTPDIRTRAKLMTWATRVTIRYTIPMLSDQTIATLLSAAGMIIGVGDFRQEKGKGNNGLFEIVEPQDPRLLDLIEHAGAAAQRDALANPVCSDVESEELFIWWQAESETRREGNKHRDAAPSAEPGAEEGEEGDEARPRRRGRPRASQAEVIAKTNGKGGRPADESAH